MTLITARRSRWEEDVPELVALSSECGAFGIC
jgi:hypothetical protein